MFSAIYIVFYCIVLYFISLYCIVLYCIVLYCTVLYSIILYCIVLYCIVLYCIVLYCIVMDRIVCCMVLCWFGWPAQIIKWNNHNLTYVLRGDMLPNNKIESVHLLLYQWMYIGNRQFYRVSPQEHQSTAADRLWSHDANDRSARLDA